MQFTAHFILYYLFLPHPSAGCKPADLRVARERFANSRARRGFRIEFMCFCCLGINL